MYQVLGLNVKTGETITVVVKDEALKEEILTFLKSRIYKHNQMCYNL